MKKHLLQFQKIGFILKVSLEKTLSMWQKIQYALNVSLEETLSTIWQIWMSREFYFKVKDVSWSTPFIILKNFNLYKRSLEERLSTIPQFHKFQYILKVSLQETSSIIPKNWIYTERPPSIEATLWRVSLQETLSI